ncbi:ABZJ_00895 family protein [Photobacterium swingsii]|uniref:ABZJ_00895 family protein n=1 Tax=Photobacterium swingsii TaxID=680026 RepID=UPI003D0B1E6C
MSEQALDRKNEESSGYFVALVLCLASVVWGFLIYLVEYVTERELSGVGTLSTIIPALTVGYYFGYKHGALMLSKTRWQALLIWTVASFAFLYVISLVEGISLYDLAVEFGWLSLILVAVVFITLLLAYFVFKSGEKMGIKALAKTSSKAKTKNI